MNPLACATLVLLVSACATAPDPQPLHRRHALSDATSVGPRLQLVSAPMDQGLERSRIGKADLDQARTLLSRARNDLEPRHWELLDRKLTEAEHAWERFFVAARTSGEGAEVVRGAEGLARTGRVSQASGVLSRVGPLLVALVLLWPASTAEPEYDSRPPWADAQVEFEARLRDVSEASRQLMAQLAVQPVLAEAEDGEPAPQPQPEASMGSPPAPTQQGRPRCQPVPVPHLGGDDAHNRCADTFPPNRFPGNDVLVDGKRFDALQVGVLVLWEIKTDRFDTYSPFLQEQVIRKQIAELRRERDIAEACGYGFVVGVSSAAHKAALEREDRLLNIVVTGC